MKNLSLLISDLRLSCNDDVWNSNLHLINSAQNNVTAIKTLTNKSTKRMNGKNHNYRERETRREGSPDLSEMNFNLEEINFCKGLC